MLVNLVLVLYNNLIPALILVLCLVVFKACVPKPFAFYCTDAVLCGSLFDCTCQLFSLLTIVIKHWNIMALESSTDHHVQLSDAQCDEDQC